MGKVRRGFYKPVRALYFPKMYTNNLERMREPSTAKLSVKHIADHTSNLEFNTSRLCSSVDLQLIYTSI